MTIDTLRINPVPAIDTVYADMHSTENSSSNPIEYAFMTSDSHPTTFDMSSMHTDSVTITSFGSLNAKSKYSYNEDKNIQQIKEYIDGTYNQHYVGNKEIQTVDFWESLGTLSSTSRDTAIKYLARYGKKEGRNKKDLLKAAHYIILMMYAHDKETNE